MGHFHEPYTCLLNGLKWVVSVLTQHDMYIKCFTCVVLCQPT